MTNALTAVKPNAEDPAQHYSGFTLEPSTQSLRLLELTFFAETAEQFLQTAVRWPVQALGCRPLLYSKVGEILDNLYDNQLQFLLLKTLLDRAGGALLINTAGVDDVTQVGEMVKLAMAVAHLIGRPSFDAMSDQYYARFMVKDIDNSDNYLRQPHRVMELHNDGTYLEEVTDYVLTMKIGGQNMTGGNSLLLYLDDWEYLDQYFTYPPAHRAVRPATPPGKNVSQEVSYLMLGVDQQGRPVMRYINRFVQPEDYEEDVWLSDPSDALETSRGIISIPVSAGKSPPINNLFWLHGCDCFTSYPDLHRELARQRDYSTYTANYYQIHQ